MDAPQQQAPPPAAAQAAPRYRTGSPAFDVARPRGRPEFCVPPFSKAPPAIVGPAAIPDWM
eukprot:9638325-Lingulodinium_polyedra.AAC.1